MSQYITVRVYSMPSVNTFRKLGCKTMPFEAHAEDGSAHIHSNKSTERLVMIFKSDTYTRSAHIVIINYIFFCIYILIGVFISCIGLNVVEEGS